MQNNNKVAAAASASVSSAPATVIRSQTDDTISAMLFNSASLLPPPLHPPTPIAQPTVQSDLPPTQDEMEQAEVDEVMAVASLDKARKRVALKTREHIAARTRLIAMRLSFAAKEKADKVHRMKLMIEQRELSRQRSEE